MCILKGGEHRFKANSQERQWQPASLSRDLLIVLWSAHPHTVALRPPFCGI